MPAATLTAPARPAPTASELPRRHPPRRPPPDESLNPAQQQVLAALGAPAAQRPVFRAGLAADLRAELSAAVAPLLPHLPDDPLHVSKRALEMVHGCEAHLLAERAERFEWTVPTARGTVVHKAIQLSVNLRSQQPPPLVLVDEALGRLADGDRSLAGFLRACGEFELAELRGVCHDLVHKFVDGFPPLQPRWRPVTEASVRVELLDGRIVLNGKPDLTLGSSRGARAGKVVLDLKTGGFKAGHLDDLRFYALLETLRFGVPPRLLAGYYVDSGELRREEVSEGLLDAALARTVDGVHRLVELLASGDDPLRRAGPGCRWCPLAATCADGAEWLVARDELV
jgi:hypothetical protein